MQEYATPPRNGQQAQPELRTTIRIEVAPDGLHITAEYVGTLGSIPAAVERLRAAGVLELVRPAGLGRSHARPWGNLGAHRYILRFI